MRGLYDFIVEPVGGRYDNIKKINDQELILNTQIFHHQYVNRKARVLSIPILINTNIQVGDMVVVHHNIFRRWHDIRGKEKNSKSYINENTYAVREDQIFAYKRDKLENTNTCGGGISTHVDGEWKSTPGYCFVKPIKSNNKLNIEQERPLVGIMKYTNKDLPDINNGDLIGFTPDSEYEFIIDGERLYRVLINSISIKYEYQGDEEEYNPSWTQSGGGINKSC